MAWRMSSRSRQFFEERLCLLEVSRLEPLREPAVNRRQHLPRFFSLPLPLPQPAQAQRGSQLQRLRTLATGNLDRLTETGFCVALDSWIRTLGSRLQR